MFTPFPVDFQWISSGFPGNMLLRLRAVPLIFFLVTALIQITEVISEDVRRDKEVHLRQAPQMTED
jgi:hypothetical protein